MLKEIDLANFTTFSKARFEFSPGLNVVVGENGTGKTHVLKSAYSAIYVIAQGMQESGNINPTKAYFQTAVAKKLVGVFKPDSLGRLARRNRQGRQRCEVSCQFSLPESQLAFAFDTSSKSEVKFSKTTTEWIDKLPVYLPTRELLSIYPGFVSLYETTYLPFEQMWRDTCLLLGAPLARGPRTREIKKLLEPLETSMGGKVLLDDSGGFYLSIAGVNMEMHLVAEGLRKLAMIARLIATGSLLERGCLFWDEPEANLNPKIVKLLAKTILHLCQNGIQVFIATHSLFLMRELDILLQTAEFSNTNSQFFGLHQTENGVDVEQGNSIDDIGSITSLEEELTQADCYLGAGGN
jgi:predicted ATPase